MSITERKLRVFLCHATVDKPVVKNLYKSLISENWIEPWLDIVNILPGQHWTTVIRQAIDSADVIIIFISNNSIDREGFVQREMNFAWERSLEKPKNTIFLIPLRLENCEVPYDLREKHWVDFFGEKKADTYQSLLKSLEARYEQVLDREGMKPSKEDVISHRAINKVEVRDVAKETIVTQNSARSEIQPSLSKIFKGIFWTIVPGILAAVSTAIGFGLIVVGPDIGITNIMFALALGPLLSSLALAISGIGALLAFIKLIIARNISAFGELMIAATVTLAILVYEVFLLWDGFDALSISLGYR